MKLKTKSAASKRFKLTANGKAIRRPVKQSHFNALASGNETRRKHGDAGISDSDTHRLDDLLSK